VSDYIHPITYEAAYQVASNLRPEDAREVIEGHGHIPKIHIPLFSRRGFCVYFTVPNGKTAGIAGVTEDGAIWMLCTNAIHEYPITFAREAKRFIDSRPEKLLWNLADKRNKLHLKLLKFLGFKFLREVTYGPNNLTFIEFCKCANQSP
jgi:hypothetical protein